MIPRFSNPHFLPQITKPATRAELYAIDDAQGEGIDDSKDAAKIARLTEILSQNFPVLEDKPPRHKRRKVACDQGPVQDLEQDTNQTVFFRLLSYTLPPLPVSLLPRPPPPSITREPDIEDNEEQALRRKQRAAVSAVEAEVIIKEAKAESHKASYPNRSSSTFQLALGDNTLPSVMIVQKLQDFRRTRPPVAPSRLQLYPYVADKASISPEPSKSSTTYCPVVDVKEVVLQSNKRRRRRRRGTNEPMKVVRPPPKFWKPDPAWKGKCMGYGYGYPSSWFPGEISENRKYRRDSMKKAVFSPSKS